MASQTELRQRQHDTGKQSRPPNGSSEDVRQLPPSAKCVFTTLQYQGEMTQIELAEETRLATRTVRYVINRLADAASGPRYSSVATPAELREPPFRLCPL